MSLIPIDHEIVVEYQSTNVAPGAPQVIQVRWRCVAHELDGQGQLTERLTPVAVFQREWTPIARRYGPQEHKT